MPLMAHSLLSLAASLFVAVVLIATLVLGRELLIPMALATILAFILSPIVAWLTTRKLPRSVAVTAVVVTLIAVVATSTFAFSRQLLSLTAGLATYEDNIVRKVRSVMGGGTSDGVIQKAANSISSIEAGVKRELGTTDEKAPAIPVTVPVKPTGSLLIEGPFILSRRPWARSV